MNISIPFNEALSATNQWSDRLHTIFSCACRVGRQLDFRVNSRIAKGYQHGISAVLVMCTVPVTIKAISADPWVIGVSRLTVGSLLILCLMPSSRQVLKLGRRDLITLGSLGLFFALHWLTYFFSIKLGTATMAVVATISFYGIFNSILGAVFLGYAFRWFHSVGLLICFVGTFLTVDEFAYGSDALLGFGAGVLSGFFFALLPTIHQKSKHLDSNLRTFGQMLGALICFLFVIPLGEWSLSPIDWLGLLYLGSVGTVLAHTLWVHATTELPTTAASIVNYLYIPSAAILSYFALGEALTPMQVTGALVIIAGSLIGVFGDKFSLKNRLRKPDEPCRKNA